MKKVLVCEDDESIAEICELILTKMGCNVQKCEQISNIYEIVEKVQPDLILMDLWMPEIGGSKATELLKTSNKYKHIPIIIFSANNEIEKVSINLMADGFIKKPFEVSHFEETVHAYIK